MAEIEVKTLVLDGVVQNCEQQKIQNYKNTFTFFDCKPNEKVFALEKEIYPFYHIN